MPGRVLLADRSRAYDRTPLGGPTLKFMLPFVCLLAAAAVSFSSREDAMCPSEIC